MCENNYEIDDLYGFKVKHKKEEMVYEILDIPPFPQQNILSKKLYNEIEKVNFNYRKIEFPINLVINEIVKEIEYDKIKNFTFLDIHKLIQDDKNKFINSNTFVKIQLTYENKICKLSFFYYTIKENGNFIFNSIDDLIDFIFITYDKKIFTKKFIKVGKTKFKNIPNYIEFIPNIPLQWLEFDEKNDLIYFDFFVKNQINIKNP